MNSIFNRAEEIVLSELIMRSFCCCPMEQEDCKNSSNFLFFEKRKLDRRNKNSIIILTEPTTPLIFMRNPVGLFHLWGVLCINIQNKY